MKLRKLAKMAIENRIEHSFVIKGKDFGNAGNVSTKIKDLLKEIGIPPSIIRRVAIATYEAEMNVVMYANHGTLNFALTPQKIEIVVDDRGPGIEDIELAMQEGYSTATEEMREMGFGAGMGLPNIKKNSDEFEITSEVNKGTKLRIVIYLDSKNE
ncbi:anti-sigma regulatory factor [Candidatus Aminicenantes bacterium AC-335-B20]|jgi:anti-sigma regulatory factor (Ser/Thr protein kinase)|nr:anti-sigma regulatory factor [SCandidatus Aminicenantes bacterium Aminicenantia_JdfR_composite]MCP2598074.1 anti-sigma regulatory factor [Candidatus Aminicenantes bacterium AC-335-L06]MCP2598958.1 anti-sigma regulatory factor [Candidatus Aminicenantes bacterium AC-335-B20]MCP2605788.1 anti-sigma regulatory factor [Candidatus Aminicenantes bacterium AC-335-O07]MCP2606314.1 anti-sigma regulatory factor [Candidatus Aminicenantes bacterium AC-708-I09]MCP2618342.1 anti-sigma regulatory factor [C